MHFAPHTGAQSPDWPHPGQPGLEPHQLTGFASKFAELRHSRAWLSAGWSILGSDGLTFGAATKPAGRSRQECPLLDPADRYGGRAKKREGDRPLYPDIPLRGREEHLLAAAGPSSTQARTSLGINAAKAREPSTCTSVDGLLPESGTSATSRGKYKHPAKSRRARDPSPHQTDYRKRHHLSRESPPVHIDRVLLEDHVAAGAPTSFTNDALRYMFRMFHFLPVKRRADRIEIRVCMASGIADTGEQGPGSR
jgi:hypothetical protein